MVDNEQDFCLIISSIPLSIIKSQNMVKIEDQSKMPGLKVRFWDF